MNTLGQNIKLVRKNAKLTQEQLAEKIGVKRASIAQYETDVHSPSLDKLYEIAEITNSTITDLLPDSERQKEKIAKEEIKNNPSKYSSSLALTKNENSIDLPYFENSYACQGSNSVLNYEDQPTPITFDKRFLEKHLNMKKFDKLHIINSIGNSMEPTIKEGELLVVNPIENESGVVQSGAIYTVLYYGDPLVKRVVRNAKSGEITLFSDNEKYNPIEILEEDKHDFKIIGRVLAHFTFL